MSVFDGAASYMFRSGPQRLHAGVLVRLRLVWRWSRHRHRTSYALEFVTELQDGYVGRGGCLACPVCERRQRGWDSSASWPMDQGLSLGRHWQAPERPAASSSRIAA